jgi:glycosyltransferase involved in cell wall biosynthesis
MRILMLATVPYFRPRGTPLSVYFRLKAIRALGHTVDLVTYPIGDPMPMDGVEVMRARRFPGIRRVGIGPSIRKAVLDWLVRGEARRRLRAGAYDLVHSHEEAAFFARTLAREHSLPHLYDMHSHLSEQLHHYGAFGAAPFRRLFANLESRTIREASSIVVISPALLDVVRRVAPTQIARTVLIENMVDAADLPGARPRPQLVDARARLGLPKDRIVALYVGSLEPYQGIDLLLESVGNVVKAYPKITFVIVGGEPWQVDALRRVADRVHAADHCVFTGSRPVDEMPDFLSAADILLSPRANGANAPSKIYGYLKSGKPIVATDLPAHSQILGGDISVLTPKNPASFSEAILRLARDPQLRSVIGAKARAFAAERYSFDEFVERTRQALALARG